jgi:decaprenylphospho-beta-D-erythro-pentofuranosid-2-ulose 2-reductase
MNGPGERRVLLLGGSSEIGLAIVRRLASEGPVRPYLLGRDRARLADAVAALARAGCTGAEVDLLEADDLDSHGETIGRAFERSGGFDLVVLAVGVLGAQQGLDADPGEAAEVMRVNFVGCGSLLLHCMRRLRDQPRGDTATAGSGGTGGSARARPAGTIVVLSSVAAERPRAGNAIYGAAKAGLDSLAQGLADSTAAAGGPRVLVVRPGFVKTRMTAGLAPAPLAATPEGVAEATARALSGGAHTIWVPGRLRFIFAVLRHLPRPVYRRLPI